MDFKSFLDRGAKWVYNNIRAIKKKDICLEEGNSMVGDNNVFDVCDLIIIFEMHNNRQVSNLRLQKLLYFIWLSL